MSIKAITFDFWQTLYQNGPVDYGERLRRLHADLQAVNGRDLTLEEVKTAVSVARQTWSRTWAEEHRTLSARDWLLVMLQQLQLELVPEQLLAIETRMEESALIDRPIVVAEAHSVLADLAQQYRLAVISDTGITPGRVLRQILTEDGLAGYFTYLTFSDELGRSKPHPDAFRTTLAALDAEPAESVHVGDLLRTDILGAKRMGMRGVQYTGVQQDDWSMAVMPDVTVTPDAVIERHTELPALLERWHTTP